MRRLGMCCLVLVACLFLLPLSAMGGDPQRGEALFVGTVAFESGGAPCLACHGIAGHKLGHAAGASYGPDLTSLFADYDEDGVLAVLEDPSAFDSMAAIYANRPLTDTERTDLLAFFASIEAEAAPDIGAALGLHVGIVAAILVFIFAGLGWRRLKSVRRPMVEQARYGKGEVA